MLHAYKIAIVPTIVYAVALWGIGLVGGYVVAFHPVLGPPSRAAACGALNESRSRCKFRSRLPG